MGQGLQLQQTNAFQVSEEILLCPLKNSVLAQVVTNILEENISNQAINVYKQLEQRKWRNSGGFSTLHNYEVSVADTNPTKCFYRYFHKNPKEVINIVA